MTRAIDPKCSRHPNPQDCEGALATYNPKFDSYSLLARFGGVKASGVGRENSKLAIYHYPQMRAVPVSMNDVEAPS